MTTRERLERAREWFRLPPPHESEPPDSHNGLLRWLIAEAEATQRCRDLAVAWERRAGKRRQRAAANRGRLGAVILTDRAHGDEECTTELREALTAPSALADGAAEGREE